MFRACSKRKLRNVLKFKVDLDMDKAMDQILFIPIKITSAMAQSAVEIKEEIDASLVMEDDQESSINIEPNGSFEINANLLYDQDSDFIRICAEDSVNKNINQIKSGG